MQTLVLEIVVKFPYQNYQFLYYKLNAPYFYCQKVNVHIQNARTIL